MIDSYRLFFWKNPFLQKSISLMMQWDYAEVGLVYLLSFPIMTIRLMPFLLIWMPRQIIDDHHDGLIYWMYFLPLVAARMLCEWVEFRRGGVAFAHWKKQQSLYEGLMPLFCVAAIQ